MTRRNLLHGRPLRPHKPQTQRRPQWVSWWSVCLCAFCFAAVAGMRCLYSSGCLNVKSIRICGCSRLPPSQVQALSRIQEGQNIFTINLNAESRRLERDPWIDRAIVKRSLPSAIDIQIIERNPVAVIKQDDFYLVDDHGEIFKKAAEHERVYPLLTWAAGDPDSDADGASVQMISAALSLIARLHECGLNPDAGTTVEMSRDLGLTLSKGADGARIYLGFDGFAEKLQRAALILNDLSSKGLAAATIHLGSGHKAYVRLHDAQEQHI